MKIKELRLGNLLTTDGEVFAVTSITDSVVWAGEQGINSIGFDAEEFGVPLTEEWLVKFGFEPNGNSGMMVWRLKINHAGYFQWFDDGSVSFLPTGCDSAFCPDVQIDHVHQLQNLYFALTGTELVYKV